MSVADAVINQTDWNILILDSSKFVPCLILAKVLLALVVAPIPINLGPLQVH